VTSHRRDRILVHIAAQLRKKLVVVAYTIELHTAATHNAPLKQPSRSLRNVIYIKVYVRKKMLRGRLTMFKHELS